MKQNSNVKTALFVLFMAVISCAMMTVARHKKYAPEVAFYYWKSGLALGDKEKEILKDNKTTNVYIRYFDVKVGERGEVMPESPVHGRADLTKLNVIPVIFIKNEVFLQVRSDDSLRQLATKMITMVRQINDYYKVKPSEIQFDCDWTPRTRDHFFAFLRECKRIYPVTFSATIRLHQVKFAATTGIPPVDKGMLMYYNMGEIAPDSLNSIYSRDVALQYVRFLKSYSLPLDVALPIYSWGVRVRDNKVTQLLSKLNTSDLEHDNHFESIAENLFKVVAPCFKHGFYFRTGDEIKIEYATAEQLLQIAEDISDNIRQVPRRVAFFDLDTLNTNRYEKETFTKVAHSLN